MSLMRAAMVGAALRRHQLRRRRGAGGAGVDLDADAQAVINAMSPEPDETRQGHINDLVVALKNAGVWAQLDFLHVYAAHSETSALINWKNPGTHNATAVNAPTFTTDRGFAGNGTSSYLNTNFTPSSDGVNYTQNDASFGVYSRSDVAAGAVDMGVNVGSQSWLNTRNPSNQSTARIHAGTDSVIAANTDSTGLFVARRSSSSLVQIFRNGVLLGTETQSTASLPTGALYVGARNDSGAAFFTTRQYSVAFACAAMSAEEQADFYTILQNGYLASVGAAIGGDAEIDMLFSESESNPVLT